MPRPLLSRCLLAVVLPATALGLTACGDQAPVDRFDSPAHTAEAFTEHFLERHAPQLCAFTGTVRAGKVVAYREGGANWTECLDMWARTFDLYEPSGEPTIGHGIATMNDSGRFATAHWPGFRIDLARAGKRWLVTKIAAEPTQEEPTG